MTLEIQVLDWDMHKNVAGLSQLIGSWSKMFIYLTIQSFELMKVMPEACDVH